jgi:hypothetical protein
MKPSGLLLLRFPPKNSAKLPSIEIAPASVAVMVIDQRVTVLHMRKFMRHHGRHFFVGQAFKQADVEAATAAFSGLRPVAKAFGC